MLPGMTSVAVPFQWAAAALEPQLQAVNQSLQEISGGLNCAVSAETGAS